MQMNYTDERNTLLLIALLKEHGIRRIIASPGTCNVPFVASIQEDPDFEIYSSVDERSAAYMACGMAAQSGEPVALSCTGATASRNYVSGLTEAFYRKLPVLAITSSVSSQKIGHYVPQVTDRRSPMPDIVKLSVEVPQIKDEDDRWDCYVKINKALLELQRNGGGPVHINLITAHKPLFSMKELPKVQPIKRIKQDDPFPVLSGNRVGIFVGAHKAWSQRLTEAVDAFCEKYNAVVLSDLTGNYKGRYGLPYLLITNQAQYRAVCCQLDIMIHIGEVSGSDANIRPKHVWRVDLDGELRDTFGRLRYIFEMEEDTFFEKMVSNKDIQDKGTILYDEWIREYDKVAGKIPELPFSNGWIAKHTLHKLPEGSILHLGILSSLRMWNYFSAPKSVCCYANTGGFGIDGGVSSLIGASLMDSKKIFFGVFGDLAFFYDMNALGNRQIGNNVRIMLVNNGCGNEFHAYQNLATVAGLGDKIDPYIAAAGHFGNKSRNLVRHYAEDMGFTYLSASDKEEYLTAMNIFIQPEMTESPLLLEVFTERENDSAAHEIIDNLEVSVAGATKRLAKDILGAKGVDMVKKVIGR